MTKSFKHISTKPDSFATKGGMVVPDDNDRIECKAIEVVDISGGTTLVFEPQNNDDGDTITVTGVYVGYTPKFRIKRVNTGTNCGVAALLD